MTVNRTTGESHRDGEKYDWNDVGRELAVPRMLATDETIRSSSIGSPRFKRRPADINKFIKNVLIRLIDPHWNVNKSIEDETKVDIGV